MWSIGEVKSKGKGAFKANYWPCVDTSLLLGVLTDGSSGSLASSGSNALSASSEGQDDKLEMGKPIKMLTALSRLGTYNMQITTIHSGK